MSGYDRGRRDDFDRDRGGGRRDDYDRDRSSHRGDDRRGKRFFWKSKRTRSFSSVNLRPDF